MFELPLVVSSCNFSSLAFLIEMKRVRGGAVSLLQHRHNFFTSFINEKTLVLPSMRSKHGRLSTKS